MASILIIDRDQSLAAAVAGDLSRAMPKSTWVPAPIDVTVETDFSKARARLRLKPPALLVTALQLGEYNGMHLVYVAAAAGLPTRCVVHTDAVDPVQAQEVRAAGAFYEIRARLAVALPAYVSAALPAQDRRNPLRYDRRRLARGGRRAADPRPSI